MVTHRDAAARAADRVVLLDTTVDRSRSELCLAEQA
jgi:hypothetical protein